MKYLCIIFLLATYSCSNSSQKSALQTTITSEDTSIKDEKVLNLAQTNSSNIGDSAVVNKSKKITSRTEKSYKYIAKCAIASIMGKDPKKLKCKKDNNLYVVSYTLNGNLYQYKIEFLENSNNRIMWGNLDGRWRNDNMDEKIFFNEENNKINIIQEFSDGSRSINEFSHQ